MSDKEYFETGVGNEVTADNMTKHARDVYICNLGAAATGNVTGYITITRDCQLLGMYATIGGDPGASGADFTVAEADGSPIYGTVSFANGAAAGTSGSADLPPITISAGTAIEVQKSQTTTSAVTGSVTVTTLTLDA